MLVLLCANCYLKQTSYSKYQQHMVKDTAMLVTWLPLIYGKRNTGYRRHSGSTCRLPLA